MNNKTLQFSNYSVYDIGGGRKRIVFNQEPPTVPNFTFGQYQPTAPINLTNLFPRMSNPYMSGLFNTGYNAPSMPSFNNMGGFYGASRFLNPGVTSGLLNTGMMTAPTQTTTSNM